MSKGSGSGGAGGGSRARASQQASKAAFLKSGLSGHQVPQSGLRDSSFAHLRGGGEVHGSPVTVKVPSKGSPYIVDGRHRITIARERGQSTIHARVIGEGSRGGTTWRHTGNIKI